MSTAQGVDTLARWSQSRTVPEKMGKNVPEGRSAVNRKKKMTAQTAEIKGARAWWEHREKRREKN